MTTIINTFSNRKFFKNIFETDLLIWITSLLHYKALDYKLKLYCTEDDVQYLKDNYLYYLYDEIDTTCFDNTDYLNDGSILDDRFWFIRKFAAIDNEFKLGNTDFIYSDTDVILFQSKEQEYKNYDIYGWCLEQVPLKDPQYQFDQSTSIYGQWEYLSKPFKYKDKDFIKKTNNSIINCGLMYFKKKEYFDIYKEEVLQFIQYNPGICYNKIDKDNNVITACNAEQRILTALANENEWNVGVFDENSDYLGGISSNGCHYYIYRALWRLLFKQYDPTNINKEKILPALFNALQKMIDMVKYALEIIKKNMLPEVYDHYSSMQYISNILQLQQNLEIIFKNYLNQNDL